MVLAIDTKKSFPYVLECDRKQPCQCKGEKEDCTDCNGTGKQDVPTEKKTIFKLKVLTARELAKIQDNVTVNLGSGDVALKGGQKILDILASGIVGWENLKDGEGKDVDFKKEKGNYENWDYLSPDHRRELADAITEQNRMTEETVKN
ncbi:hypothetical protein LCGC14_0667260 [marine sediment metagenome]|uniref:Uncharacterized protein n=1 Tax=marine sediment metagenome TaxID=412755 RepID=A0A0F9TDB8_9ZZZZ